MIRGAIGTVAALVLAARVGAAQTVSNPHGKLSLECAACHAPDAWKPARVSDAFKHAARTFPLEGAHTRTTCTGCHKRLDFKGLTPKCASCHEDVHKGELGADCARCHTPRSFAEEPAMKQAHDLTRFPLRGAHAAVTCSACHTRSSSGQLQFVGRGTTCQGCHAADARAVTVPDHQGAAFTDCTACHSISTWRNARFDHSQTAFPLQGAHRAVTCDGCHADRVFKGKDTGCVSCHQADYDQAATPRHSDGFPTTCADCHGNTAWKGATFDHSTSSFPLTGAHRATSCGDCHGDGVYNGKSTDCASCHRARYDATTSPAHAAAGYSTMCATCHNTTAWAGAVFNHSTTQFPLTGAHLATPCQSCHADGVYRGKSTDCYSCHRASYDATRQPPHGSSGIGTLCTSCHTTSAWAGGTYDHSVTRFPLTGAHRAASCAACHADGVYSGKSMECLSCHQADYNGTTQPPHGSSGIGTTCSACHTTTAWIPGTFNHGATAFPLTGAHTTVACLGCHGDGVYKGKSTACASCHQTDYNQTTNPNHLAASFPTTCASCHTTTTWLGATFDHDSRYFPIYSGKHAGKWSSCATCHTSPTNYQVFTCLTCHEQISMDDKHKAMSGYRYDSQTCYSCHPRGTKP